MDTASLPHTRRGGMKVPGVESIFVDREGTKYRLTGGTVDSFGADGGIDRNSDRYRRGGTRVRRSCGHPRGAGTRTLGYVPDRHRQADEGHGSVRTDHRPRVRGYRRIIAHLRAVRRRIGPWMDERVRCHQHAFHRGSHDFGARGRRNRRRSTCRVWLPGNSPVHFPCRSLPSVPMLLPYRPRRSGRTPAIT